MEDLTKHEVLYLMKLLFSSKETLKLSFTNALLHDSVEKKLTDMLVLTKKVDTDLDKKVKEYVDALTGFDENNEIEEFEEAEEVEVDLKDVELIESDPAMFVPVRDSEPKIKQEILGKLPKFGVKRSGRTCKMWFVSFPTGLFLKDSDSVMNNGLHTTKITRTVKGLRLLTLGYNTDLKVEKFPKTWTKALKLGVKYSVVP